MIIGITGARVFRENDVYKVEYHNTIIYESKSRNLAVILALCKNKCEELLTAK
jgi:hypothetical protein